MADLTESAVWEDGIYQLELADKVKGGDPAAGGIANQPHAELANRTVYLKGEVDKLKAGPHQFVMIPRAGYGGSVHWQCWIPTVRIPALSLGGAFPAADLDVGGFWVDTYLCSHRYSEPWSLSTLPVFANPGEMGNDDQAWSVPGRIPWALLELDIAENACALRASFSELMSAQAWAEVALIARWLGYGSGATDIKPRGNANLGRDPDDPNLPEYFGSMFGAGPTGNSRNLTGVGPRSFRLGNDAQGIADWWGNCRVMTRMDLVHGYYRHPKGATLSADITAGATSLTLKTVERASLWPDDGELLIGSEEISYTSFADNGDDTYTLGGLTRGINGTSATTHDTDDGVTGYRLLCVIPYGATWLVNGSGVDSVGGTTLAIDTTILGANGSAPQVGDIVVIEDEQMTVDADLGGGSYTVTRGAHGTTAVAHPDNTRGCHVRPTDSTHTVDTAGPKVTGYMATPREDDDMVRMLWPATMTAAAPDDSEQWGDYCEIFLGTAELVTRGRGYPDWWWGPRGEALSYLTDGDENYAVGFRAMSRRHTEFVE